MHQIIAVLVLSAIALLTSACNTMEGMGKDVQKAGKSIERSADKHK